MVQKRNISGLRPFKPGQCGNPKGRPVSTVRKVIQDLEAAGYQPASRMDILAMYTALVGLPLEDLNEIASDAKRPMISRIVARALLAPKGFENVERIMDRIIGKPTQRSEVTGADGGPLKVEDETVKKALASALSEFEKANG